MRPFPTPPRIRTRRKYETPYTIREAFLSRERKEAREKQGWNRRQPLTATRCVAVNHGTETKFKWVPLEEVTKIARSVRA